MSIGNARKGAKKYPPKSAAAFRTIGEVAGELGLPQHVLRFWETRFPSVKPAKRSGGRRYYRPEDVDLLRRICQLLYEDGYTIKGVQKLLRQGPFAANALDKGFTAPLGSKVVSPLDEQKQREIKILLKELETLRDLLSTGG